ncbi:MAG: aminopeptidase [Candidatus Eisenbacteria bacterium]|nr:aminopeptidase [Candidatus Eisenbacteria bacterium]
MKDPRVERLARLICRYSIGVKKGDAIVIAYEPVGEPLAEELYRETLSAGGHPILRIQPGWAEEIFFREAAPHQLDQTSPSELHEAEMTRARILVWAKSNTRRNSGVDPKKVARAQRARRRIVETYFSRMAKKEWTFMIAPFPVEAEAQEADMALSEYEDFVYRALFVDRKDPIAEWKKISARQAALVRRFNHIRDLRIVGEDTDIRMSVKGRKWINCDGHHNLPDGEIFTGPVEDSVEGTIRYTYPAIYQGREVTDVRLAFRKGKVVKAEAAKGEDLLKSLLDMDEGARRVGEVAVGTNYGITRFTRSILFDEKIGGSIHMAVGRSIPESGGMNQSTLHWDMIKDMRKGGEIHADGKVVFRNGKFLAEV